ncbi:MAG: polyprenyl diphosphate synthase [Candidatus Micrarchaeia archaeon]
MPARKTPKHMLIIPDGNRRWARLHGKPVIQGHAAGIDKIGDVLRWCRKRGIRTLTLWGFSTENFQRPESEVKQLMRLFETKLREILSRKDARRKNVRVKIYGALELLPARVRDYLKKAEEATARHRAYRLNILLSYGGRAELLAAVNEAMRRARAGRLARVDEKSFRKLLWTGEIPDPDLIIRTSGEMRTSGVLPWHSAYSELHFSPKLWPDFSEQDFDEILEDYASRQRRFGR